VLVAGSTRVEMLDVPAAGLGPASSNASASDPDRRDCR